MFRTIEAPPGVLEAGSRRAVNSGIGRGVAFLAYVWPILGIAAVLVMVPPDLLAAETVRAASNGVSCHGQAHALGAAIAEQSATLTEAMLACSDRCTFGCVHGAFRAYFGRKMNLGGQVPPDVQREIREVCRADSTIMPDFFRGNCAHSVGHALAIAAPDDRAALHCGLFLDPEMRFYCETGVFMEYRDAGRSSILSADTFSASNTRTGIEYCATHSVSLGACLRFVWPKPTDLAESRGLILGCRALDESSRRGCVYAAGFAARGYVRSHPDQVERVCGAAASEDRALCVAGVVLMKKDYEGRTAIPSLCSAIEDAALRAVCDDQAARYYYQVDNPVIRAMVGVATAH